MIARFFPIALLAAATLLTFDNAKAEELFVSQPLTANNSFTAGIEGPACDADGNIYAVNFSRQQTIGRVTPEGNASVFVVLPKKSTGNGIRFDRKGFMYVADYVNHNVLRVDPKTRKVTVLAHHGEMSQPNDLAIGPDGTLYASDPNWGAKTGRIWRVDRKGKVTLAAAELGTTNGIEVSPDGKTLATAGQGPRRDRGPVPEVLLWDVATGKQVLRCQGDLSRLFCVAFSPDGSLTAAAFAALERLAAAGILTVPITGRPAGWCDHIARMWPVNGVVGENGAFYFRYDHVGRKMHKRFLASDRQRREARVRLDGLKQAILAEVPGSAVASDQHYRETDLAIDFCEDVERLPGSAVARIVALFESAGATAKVSSIHVNGWFGAYDKLGMTKIMMRESFDIDLDADRERFVFVGDSPNDAPMFGYFPHSVGVANVGDFQIGRAHV